jgi:adenosylhomocysteine nucleosidase
LLRKFLLISTALLPLSGCLSPKLGSDPANGIVVLISANAEWKVVKSQHPHEAYRESPWGEYFRTRIGSGQSAHDVIFFHGGWGKVAAAGSTQYCIDRWKPALLINLGTCGGFQGDIERFQVVLVDRTVIYDIMEAMGDSRQAIEDYATSIDLSWLGENFPVPARRSLLVSADRDIVPSQIKDLKSKYQAVAGDWETGAIAYTCARNRQRVLILRGVSDLVSPTAGGEAYGNLQAFEDATRVVMTKLLEDLPKWLAVLPQSRKQSP